MVLIELDIILCALFTLNTVFKSCYILAGNILAVSLRLLIIQFKGIHNRGKRVGYLHTCFVIRLLCRCDLNKKSTAISFNANEIIRSIREDYGIHAVNHRPHVRSSGKISLSPCVFRNLTVSIF